jgi:hypothetical protein
LNLGEKSYENLVEALTNNAINTVAAATSSSSNYTLSMIMSNFPILVLIFRVIG